MKLHYALSSPYVHKVMLVAHECGLLDRIELVPTTAQTVIDDVRGDNPLGQIPTLIIDDGTVLYDSLVIMEYLNHLSASGLIPPPGPSRWPVLRNHALGQGVIDALNLRFNELRRPLNEQSPSWIAKKESETRRVLDVLEVEATAAGLSDDADFGTLTIGCGLAYADRRWPGGEWRTGRTALAAWFERFAARPSMRDTTPPST
jgi:glutathione S-transferase